MHRHGLYILRYVKAQNTYMVRAHEGYDHRLLTLRIDLADE